MARTLIGNIKGKDGRGITSIVKTGTAGSVDTYTITYTDRTTSIFTVNNSDNVSLQRQIVPSAAVESSTTASQAYAAGDYVVVNGLLRKAKVAIAKGDTISDSNSAATTVAGELATLGNSSPKDPTAASVGSRASWLYANVYVCAAGVIAGGNVSPGGTIEANGIFCTITTERQFTNTGKLLLRGAFPNKQSGVFAEYSSGNTIKLSAEQKTTLASGDTLSVVIPCMWKS